jgi:hypothetical protein
MNQENSSLPSFGVQGGGTYGQESNPKSVQPVSTFPSQSMIRPRPSRRPLLKLLIIVVAIIAVLILGSYATLGYVMKPDNSVSMALNKIATDTTSHSKISLKTLSLDPKTDLANFQIAIDLDRSNKNSPKVQSSMDLHISGMADVSFEMKTVDNVIYYKIANIPELYASTYGQYADKWYSVPIQTLKDYSANYASSTTYTDVYKKSLFDWYKELVRSKYISEIKFEGVGLYAGQSMYFGYATMNQLYFQNCTFYASSNLASYSGVTIHTFITLDCAINVTPVDTFRKLNLVEAVTTNASTYAISGTGIKNTLNGVYGGVFPWS